MNLYQNRFEIRFTKNKDELIESQRLRHKIFIDEIGTSNKKIIESRIEKDKFDDYYKHLIIIDHEKPTLRPNGKIVGVTRIILSDQIHKNIGFYCAQEFNLSPIISTKKKCLEIGRTCIDSSYRNTLILHYLWLEIGAFCSNNSVELLFGVASFKGNNVNKISMALSFIHNEYLAPSEIRPKALKDGFIDMNIIKKNEIDKFNALKQMPNLLKSYFRLGAKVGEGAFIDKKLNTIDILVIVDVLNMNKKYKVHYEKK